MVWPRQKDARGENMKINYGMDTMGEKEEGTSTKERGWMEYKQPRQETQNQINGETERNGVWFPEDGDSC